MPEFVSMAEKRRHEALIERIEQDKIARPAQYRCLRHRNAQHTSDECAGTETIGISLEEWLDIGGEG